jgi:hypothetical protein
LWREFERLEHRLDELFWLLIAFYAFVLATMILMAIKLG